MILCQWDGNWFLSTGINREKGICWLRCGAKMPHNETFQPLPPVGAQLYGHTDNPEDVVVYPEIYYRGCRVWPQAWFTESAEPILKCHATPDNFDDLDSEYFREIARRINAQFPSEVMMADGWYQIERGVFEKLIHVDNLEKIEGPPPEGPF